MNAASPEFLERAIRNTSLIVPVKNDVRISRCLDSVDEQVECVIALNGATSAVRKAVQEHPLRLVVTEISEANLGAAYNAGIAAANGRYLIFMDSDCVFAPGAIRMLVGAVLDGAVAKGRVVFTSSARWISRLIGQSRTFQISDHVNAYSPPLIYDRNIEACIGGYHYDPIIHWEEDREFDFRLQLAEIPVTYVPDAIVFHAPQDGISDLRSGFRYGLGEGIGQELGLFITPRLCWRLANDARSVMQVARVKGPTTAAYRTVWLSAYHAGTLAHLLANPLRTRSRYPHRAQRVRSRTGVPGHLTLLDPYHRKLLRDSHKRQGRSIAEGTWLRLKDSLGDDLGEGDAPDAGLAADEAPVCGPSRAAALARLAGANGIALDTCRLDQHLLIDDDVISDLIDVSAVSGRSVVEIGGGAGAITERLAEQADRVLVIEVDKRLGLILDDLANRHPNVTIKYDDVKDVALNADILVANPPFAIVETLIGQLAESAIGSAALVLGEAAGRSAIAEPGSAEFGRLSLQFQAYFMVRYIREVPASAFYPAARTGACILALERASARQWPLTAIGDALRCHGGRRVTDLLWFLGSRRARPPSERDGRRVAKAARSSPAIRSLLQRRLQELSQAEISLLTSELLRIARVRPGAAS